MKFLLMLCVLIVGCERNYSVNECFVRNDGYNSYSGYPRPVIIVEKGEHGALLRASRDETVVYRSYFRLFTTYDEIDCQAYGLQDVEM